MSVARLSNPFISAVVACYGDELAIPIMYRRLVRIFELMPAKFEIIFVNDGSRDDSRSVIDALAQKDHRVVGVHHSRNFGSQLAFSSGLEQARGQAIVLLDGDLQDPPELIPAMIEQWRAGFQVVYGQRVDRVAAWYMRWAYKLFYRIFQRLSYVSVPVDAGDFSLIDRQVVEALKLFPERDRFLRGLRAWVGFKQIGVPYVRSDRVFGHSTNNLLKNIQWASKGIFSFSFVPLQLITWLSLVTFCVSLIGIVVQVILRWLLPNTPHGITTVIVVVMFLGAIQLLGISVLGEYIGRIFEEVKQRPRFVVEKVTRYGRSTPRPVK